MAWISLLLKAVVLLPAFLVLNNAINLFHNYLAARKTGCRIQVRLMTSMEILSPLFDNRALTYVRKLPFHLGDNHLTKWDIEGRCKPRRETGNMWTLVTPSYNFVYLSDPDTSSLIHQGDDDASKPAVMGH